MRTPKRSRLDNMTFRNHCFRNHLLPPGSRSELEKCALPCPPEIQRNYTFDFLSRLYATYLLSNTPLLRCDIQAIWDILFFPLHEFHYRAINLTYSESNKSFYFHHND